MKKINRFANDNTSVNPWLKTYEETFEKESDRLCEYLEEKYDDWYNPDSNAYGYIASPKKILIDTGEYLVEAYFDNLDEETYHQYKDTLDKLRGDVNNYDAFVKFVCEKANLPFKTRYDIGKDFAEKEYVYYEHEAKTTTKRLCRIGTSVRPWRQAYEDVLDYGDGPVLDLIESEYKNAYAENTVVNKTDLIIAIGVIVLDSIVERLDDETYHKYEKEIKEFQKDKNPYSYDRFAQFIGEKTQWHFCSAYEMGLKYCKWLGTDFSEYTRYENSTIKHRDKFANNSSSEDAWFQALTDTYEKEWRRIEELIEDSYSSAYYEDETKTELITRIGEHIIEAFYDNLDAKLYKPYEDILDKLFREGDNYDAFVKFIGEKMNEPFNTAYDIGEDYCKDYCDELYW